MEQDIEIQITQQKERDNDTDNGPLIITAQGPVIDSYTRTKPSSDPVTPSGEEDLNFWSDGLARAAKVLLEKGQADQIIILGGKTGGEEFKSEAELLKERLMRKEVPESMVQTENDSTDTLMNLINLINIMDSQYPNELFQNFQLLGAPFHTLRTQTVLMRLLGLKATHVFQSDEVLRYAARNYGDADDTEWNHDELNDIERRLNINNSDYYLDKKGEEKKDYKTRLIHDRLWMRELLEYPESWIGRIADVNNKKRRDYILRRANSVYLDVFAQYGIDVINDNDTEIIQKLRNIQKQPLSLALIQQWEQEEKYGEWPLVVKQRLERLNNLPDVTLKHA